MNARDAAPPLRAEQAAALASHAQASWQQRIVPALIDYIAVPAKSPMFDAAWQQRGLLERVLCDAAAWVDSRRVAGLKLQIVRLEGRTPLRTSSLQGGFRARSGVPRRACGQLWRGRARSHRSSRRRSP